MRSFGPPIEISSSPEPEDPPPPRRKPPSFRPRATQSRPRSAIELTDSDSDSSAPEVRPQYRGILQNAGSSSGGPKSPMNRGASHSQQNVLAQTKGPTPKAGSSNASNGLLFLPGDEENDPFIANANVATTPHSPRRAAGSLPLKIGSSANTIPANVHPFDAAFVQMVMPDWNIDWAAGGPPSNELIAGAEPEIAWPQAEKAPEEADTALPDPQPVVETQPDPNPESAYVASVLEIVPDVDPDHALALVLKHMPESQQSTVERVLHILLEDASYPKVQKNKGKKRQGDEDVSDTPSKKAKVDYTDKHRPFKGGPDYIELALEYLQMDFPFAPKPFLRSALTRHSSLYAPTYLYLRQAEKDHQEGKGPLPYQRKSQPYTQSSKGKRRQLHDPEFDAERAWLVAEHINPVQSQAPANVEEDVENGIECGCCFASLPFDKMVQCPEAHLFCSDCMTSYAETLLGSHNPDIKCMDQSGCKAEIPPSELKRFLPKKLLNLWERVKQRKEVQAAAIEGLEECPFCEWGCVIENPDEKLLRCGNEDECGIISCRSCKKKDHLPKSCKEAEEDKHLDSQHAVEEAMTQALMRNCPRCKKPFIKEYGCNKMSCPNCQCLSCYVCRQEIKGYDHFDQTPAHATSSRKTGKCQLYDSNVEIRHAEEVKQAAKAAMEKFKKDNPDAEEDAIKVDIPTAPAPAQRPAAPNLGMPMAPHGFNALFNQAARARAEADRNRAQQRIEAINEAIAHLEGQAQQIDNDLRRLHQNRLEHPAMEGHYRSQIIEVGENRGRIHNNIYSFRNQLVPARNLLLQAERQLAAANAAQPAIPLALQNHPLVHGAIPPMPALNQFGAHPIFRGVHPPGHRH